MKFFLVSLFSFLFFFSCEPADRPAGLPANAKHDRNMNAYVLTENGISKIYYDNGKLFFECPVDEAKLYHGFCKSYLRTEEGVSAQGNYEHGSRVGEWTWFFPDGKVYIKQKFGTGPKDLAAQFNGDEGNEDGPYERYYPEGNLEVKGHYKSGFKSDFWQKFFKDGELEYSGYYSKGKKIRTWFYYFPNRQTESVEVFDDSGKFLSRTIFAPDGKKLCEVEEQKSHCG
ncbi:hypothetical protein EHQ53_07805 [Leptospira langatensis]|uniref:Toxin-antitoxin system YwqK family antitoxin n=1 Tax=Leptospira langatensis TaxID=2484983 RepID=A0A5F1ZUI7_9LEPT|nr:hypothetical protein [Leptospira langatensis]TGK01456.1 hypothetical protein EHO57_11065 [Leptospira langatensis]TGL42094.1 hypothetical protein EHQ53_07805 [Leptospira langatensis]